MSRAWETPQNLNERGEIRLPYDDRLTSNLAFADNSKNEKHNNNDRITSYYEISLKFSAKERYLVFEFFESNYTKGSFGNGVISNLA